MHRVNVDQDHTRAFVRCGHSMSSVVLPVTTARPATGNKMPDPTPSLMQFLDRLNLTLHPKVYNTWSLST